MTELMVSEVFGPTIQGEGPSTGRRAGFVRLGRCNLDCSWCDTPYTWDWLGKNGKQYLPLEEISGRSVLDVANEMRDMSVSLVVITGGEPMLQRSGLVALVDAIGWFADIEIETNGTQEPPAALLEGTDGDVWFNVSPKLNNSGVDPVKRYKPAALDALVASRQARFKFVVVGPACLDEVDELVKLHGIPRSAVWIMPEGTVAAELEERLAGLADDAIARGYNVTSRLHVQLWGSRRGV